MFPQQEIARNNFIAAWSPAQVQQPQRFLREGDEPSEHAHPHQGQRNREDRQENGEFGAKPQEQG